MLPPESLVEGFYTSKLDSFQEQPVRTFLPTGYEPNYPYPLLVFFHGHGSNEEQILRLAPNLSRRNYVCISLRGPQPLEPGLDGEPAFGWGSDAPCDATLEEYVFRAVQQTRRYYHIHSERIFLAGVCEGATLAYRLGLTHPTKFGGVVSLNGSMPRKDAPLFRLPELRQLRVLIGHGIANPVVPLSLARRDYRLLYTAGLSVKLQTYAATHRVHSEMLRDVDRWIQRVIEIEG
ncbi:MAG: alpha/beta hydrolase [Gemmataceae bacterium]